MNPDLRHVQVVCDLRRKPVIPFSCTGIDSPFCHESLITTYIHVEEIDRILCLPLDCLGHVPACAHCVAGESPEYVTDGALLRVVSFLQRLDHLMVSVWVVEVDGKGRIVIAMDFFYTPIFRPEVDTSVPVRRVNNPHAFSGPLRVCPAA